MATSTNAVNTATTATTATTASDTLNSLATALTSRKSHRIALPRQAYPLDSPQGSRQDLLNLFAEFHPSSDARTSMFVRTTPGLAEGPTFGAGPVRALSDLTNVLYVVSGAQAYRIMAAAGPVALGAMEGAPDAMATIAVGPNQVVFCIPPNAYVCNHTDNFITQITSGVFVHGVSSVTYLDGYFIFAELDSGIVRFSKLTDAGDFDAFAFASTEATPDIVVRVIAYEGVLAIFGNNSIEFWQDVGATPVPFQRISGGVIYGCGTLTPATIESFNTTLGWLGRDGIVYQLASGFKAERISHHALEHEILSYGIFNNALACTINQQGHWFYVLTFPTAGKTWVYDAATQLWHRRGSAAGSGRWRANCSVRFGQTSMVGDYASGKLFFVDPSVDTDDGTPIQWTAIFPPLTYEGRRLFVSRLEIEMETGTARTPSLLHLDWSDDGGASFVPGRPLDAGQNTGEFKRRLYVNRLGSFRTRHFRLRGTGAATIYAADVGLKAGSL